MKQGGIMGHENITQKAEVLFEVSWEVCNKVGGIYTVVKSKAAQTAHYYKEHYFLIGPYFQNQTSGEFFEEVPLDFCKKPFEELKKEGLVCHYGKWSIPGNPHVILIDFEGFRYRVNDIKKELWENYKIDSLRAGGDYDEPVTWAYAAGKLIESLSKVLNKKIVAQFHEWLSGVALLYIKSRKLPIGTVFTTHATTLGRTLAGNNIDLYNMWDKIDADKEVYKFGVESKHFVEKQSAQNAEVFTTVSEITGMEAEHFLGKKADVLLLNGLDIEKFPTSEETAIKHRLQRERMRQFLLYYFFPYYTFDLQETLFYFIAGRNEFHAKGIDVFIKSLGLLNKKMREVGHKKTIVAFLWIPANISNIKPEILENKTYFQDVKDSLEDIKDEIHSNILYSVISNQKITNNTLFDKEFLSGVKNKLNRFYKKGLPPVSTHDLYEKEDTIIRALKEAGLTNKQEDPVKVVYYPIYLSGADRLLNLDYYESMTGSHLGIFPSYYEPWGYTPLEGGALGIASVTTDLAGFGRYIQKQSEKKKNPGIFVMNRLGKSDDDAVRQLLEIMFNYSNLSTNDRIANKTQAREVASATDWKIFITNYIEAHNMALDRVHQK
jgi:glycogen synthase